MVSINYILLFHITLAKNHITHYIDKILLSKHAIDTYMLTFPMILKDAFMLNTYVKHFVFHIQKTPAFVYLPGQFITIQFEHEGKILKRSYSIANPPDEPNRIEFSASYVEGGRASAFLFNLKPDDIVQTSGPFGRLILKDQIPKRYIFAATGTGVTPYRAMQKAMEEQLKKHDDLSIVIIEGVRNHAELLFGEEFKSFAARYPQVRFIPMFSRETPETLKTDEYIGYVQQALDMLAPNAENDLVYLCGNPNMIDACFQKLKNLSFPVQQIIREKYI